MRRSPANPPARGGLTPGSEIPVTLDPTTVAVAAVAALVAYMKAAVPGNGVTPTSSHGLGMVIASTDGIPTESEMLGGTSVPVSAPKAAGVKVTLTVHFPCAGSVDPQVVEATAKLTLASMLLIVSGPAPVLVNVTTLATLVVLMACFPKLRLIGERVTAGGSS